MGRKVSAKVSAERVRHSTHVNLLLELLLKADVLVVGLNVVHLRRRRRLRDRRLMELNLLELLAALLRVERRDHLLAGILDDDFVAASNRLWLRDDLNLRVHRELLQLLLLRPTVGVDDELLDLMLRALLLIENLWRRTCQRRRWLIDRDVGDNPRCHLLEVLIVLLVVTAVLLHLHSFVLRVVGVERDRRRCVEDGLRLVLLDDVGRRNHKRRVTLHGDELLAVGAGLQDSLNLLLRLDDVLDGLHLRRAGDLVGRRDVLQLVLLGRRLIEMQNLLLAVRALDLNVCRLQTRCLALKLDDWSGRTDGVRRRNIYRRLLDDLHLGNNLVLRDEVLLLDYVRWLQVVVLDDCWRRTRQHSLRNRNLLGALKMFQKFDKHLKQNKVFTV